MRNQTVLRALISAVASSAALGAYLNRTMDPVPSKRLVEKYRRQKRQARKFEKYLAQQLEKTQ